MHANVGLDEEDVDDADFVEAHLVNEFFENDAIFSEELDVCCSPQSHPRRNAVSLNNWECQPFNTAEATSYEE